MVNFTAVIYKLGINPAVDPPDGVLAAVFEQAGKSKGPIPVCGFINCAEFVQTLVKYGGKWRLYINSEMLKASGLKVGDTAQIEIEFDKRPRETPFPPEFEMALADDKDAARAFLALTPSRRKEILTYLGHLKTDESRRRNVKKIIAQLKGSTGE